MCDTSWLNKYINIKYVKCICTYCCSNFWAPSFNKIKICSSTFGNGIDVDLDGSANTTKGKGKTAYKGVARHY